MFSSDSSRPSRPTKARRVMEKEDSSDSESMDTEYAPPQKPDLRTLPGRGGRHFISQALRAAFQSDLKKVRGSDKDDTDYEPGSD